MVAIPLRGQSLSKRLDRHRLERPRGMREARVPERDRKSGIQIKDYAAGDGVSFGRVAHSYSITHKGEQRSI